MENFAIIFGMENPTNTNKRLKVYLETSFVSYLTGDATVDAKVAADQAFTRLWWRHPMSDTSIVDEVREIRHRIAEECENNLQKITAYANEIAKRLGFRQQEESLMSTH